MFVAIKNFDFPFFTEDTMQKLDIYEFQFQSIH